jgi:hypothetical protein
MNEDEKKIHWLKYIAARALKDFTEGRKKEECNLFEAGSEEYLTYEETWLLVTEERRKLDNG